MAIEIAIRTVKKRLRQAIFINESEIDGPLSEVRTILAKQDLDVPEDYRFLSKSGNVVPWNVESTLILREVASSRGTKANYNKNEKPDISTVKSETPDSDVIRANDTVLELWIVALGDFLDQDLEVLELHAGNNADGSDGANNETGGCRARSRPNNEQDATEERENCQLCPWKAFLNFIHDGNSSQNLFKLMFFVVALLFSLLAALVLSTYIVFRLCSMVASQPEFHSVLAGLKSDGSSAKEIVDLRLKMSELELSWKFKFDQLSGKFTELEDLYLNDLAKHKREMASLRNQRVDIARNFATLEDLEKLQTKIVEVSDYVSTHQRLEVDKTQNKKKKGKKNEGKEGL